MEEEYIPAKFGKLILLKETRIRHILSKHPEVMALWDRIPKALEKPDYVKRSSYAVNVWLYYKLVETHGKYLTIIVEIYDGKGMLLTAYITDRIKEGEML